MSDEVPKTIVNDMGESVKTDGKKHRDIFYAKVDKVVILLLETDQYLKSRASSELVRKVEKELNCQNTQARNYVSEAKKEIRRILKIKKENAFAKVIRDLELIRIRNKNGDNDKLFLETVKYYAKMNGLEIDETKTSGEITIKNIDLSKFTEHGLERLKRGDKIEEVLIDPRAVKVENV